MRCNNMQHIIKKADILIEALPYIKAFQDKIVVIKHGGSTIADEENTLSLLKDIIFLNLVGLKPVLVHGGGPAINEQLKSLGKKIKFVHGFRVTDAHTIKVVDETLSKINKDLVDKFSSLGQKAVGLTSKDKVIIAKKDLSHGELGFVGEIQGINCGKIIKLLDKKLIPVISPVGAGKGGEVYNVNADLAGAKIAAYLRAQKLVLLTNVSGILRNPGDENSLIGTLKLKETSELIKRKIISEGMIPKIKAAVNAVKEGVKKVHIIDGRLEHALLLEIFTDKGIGTEIIK